MDPIVKSVLRVSMFNARLYEVISSGWKEEVVQAVNHLIYHHGYKPQGSMSYDGQTYFQTLIKENG